VSLKSDSFHYQTSNIAAPLPKKADVKEKVFSKPLAGASWRAEYTELANEIRVRHYSPKTLKAYKQWLRQFQTYTRSKPPALLSTADVKNFLTSFAVKRQVSASTQNQAFNALLFFFRHVLHKEFGKVDGVVRAKRKRYVPVVLSREEIETILTYLAPPYDLIVKLLYGCGLRLFECLQLRVHCLNFDMGVVTVHDGKGKKDRTVPLPETILPELREHLESLKVLHQLDLDRNYAGVFLIYALEKSTQKHQRSLSGNGFFLPKTSPVYRRLENTDGIICMKRMYRRQLKRQLGRPEFVNGQQRIRFAIVLPAIYYRPITTFGRFKNYWGTRMCEPQ